MRVHRWSKREGSRGIRAFAWAYDRADTPVAEARIEGYVASGAQHTGLSLSFEEEEAGVQVFAGLAHVACCWVTVGSWRLCKRLGLSPRDWDVADVRLHDRAVWWSLWHDKHSWHSSTPKWRNGSFRWWDWLTGKPVHHNEVIEGPVDVVVPMPEGAYKATVKLERSTWKRPRWPWPQVHYGYDLDVISRPGPDGPYVPEGADEPNGYIPVPGKGENAWDLDGDGIFSQSGPGRSVEEAITGVIKSALRDRRRRGAPLDYAEVIS